MLECIIYFIYLNIIYILVCTIYKHILWYYIYLVIPFNQEQSSVLLFADRAELRNHGHFHRLRSLTCLASHGHRLFQGGWKDALLQELTRDHELPDTQNEQGGNLVNHIRIWSLMKYVLKKSIWIYHWRYCDNTWKSIIYIYMIISYYNSLL